LNIEKMFFIPGMFSSGRAFRHYVSFFSEKGFNCQAIEYCRPPNSSLGRVGLEYYTKGVLEEIESGSIIIGHSMGGLIAQKIIAGRDDVKAAVLLAPASPYGILALRYSVIKSFWPVLSDLSFWQNKWEIGIDFSYKQARYALLNRIESEAERREIYDGFTPESGRVAGEIGFWPLDPKKASWVDESRVTCPILVIVGGKDRITPPGVAKAVAKKYRKQTAVTFKKFRQNGHWLLAEANWKEICEFIYRWLINIDKK